MFQRQTFTFPLENLLDLIAADLANLTMPMYHALYGTLWESGIVEISQTTTAAFLYRLFIFRFTTVQLNLPLLLLYLLSSFTRDQTFCFLVKDFKKWRHSLPPSNNTPAPRLRFHGHASFDIPYFPLDRSRYLLPPTLLMIMTNSIISQGR
jgi:hypothetical protein